MHAQLIAGLTRNAGGVFSAVTGLSQAMKDTGMNIHVWGSPDEHFEQDKIAWGSVPVHPYKILGPRTLGFSPTLFKDIEQADPALLHSHGIWMYPSHVAAKFRKKTDRPVVVSPHGMLDPFAMKNSYWKKRIVLSLYECRNLFGASCLHALCGSEVSSIRAFGLRQPTAVIPNGVDLPAIHELSPVPISEERTLLYLGRIHKKKNLLHLVRAWATIPAFVRKNWKLRILGWGDPEHQKALMGLQCADVSVEGPLYGRDKETAFQQASGFIHPSLSEGLPMAILEAWSFGLPVLMSRECNLPEGFKANAAIETGTTEASIAAALEGFLTTSDGTRREMGLNGRKLVEENFTWPNAASKMKSVYEWLLGKGPKPDCVV